MHRHNPELVTGVYRLDIRGDQAPQPAASRLFVQEQDGEPALIPFYRALLYHGVELASADAPDVWRDWLVTLFAAAVDLLRTSSTWQADLAKFDASIAWATRVKDERQYQSLSALQSEFGNRIPIARQRWSESVAENGVDLSDPLTRMLAEGRDLSESGEIVLG